MNQQPTVAANIYLKFESPKPATAKSMKGIVNRLRNIFSDPISYAIPRTNPIFDQHIPNVKEWIVEYDAHNGYPNREVGLDKNGQVIMIMPWQNNYGYWSDKNIKERQFFTQLAAKKTSKEEFENHWNSFEEKD